MFNKNKNDKINQYVENLGIQSIDMKYPEHVDEIYGMAKNKTIGVLGSSAGQNAQNMLTHIEINQRWIMIKQNEEIIQLLKNLNDSK